MSDSLAAVFDGISERLSLRRIPIPEPRRGEALVRVLGCTICGSDLHSVSGRRTVPTPTILGHEIVGEIVQIDEGESPRSISGEALALGDRVTWAIVASCGECFLCRRGLPQKCLFGVKYGHEAFHPGRELLGGLADHCLLVPGTAIVSIPGDLTLAAACPASCATATVVAAIDAAGELRDRSVVVIGAGMLGLTACAMAQVAGASSIVAVDLHATRRDLSHRFGAARSCAPEEMPASIREVTRGYGADVILEFSGSSTALDAARDCARLGATVVLVGAVFPGPVIHWPLETIVRRNLTIRGVHNYRPPDLLRAVQFLAENQTRFPFENLVTDWHPLEAVADAFANAKDPGKLRVGVRP